MENVTNETKPRRYEAKFSLANFKAIKVMSIIDGKSMNQCLNDLINKEAVIRWEEIKAYRDLHEEEIHNMK